MYVSIGQGGNSLAACFWQRAQHQRDTHARTHTAARQKTASHSSTRSMPPPPVSPLFASDGYAHAIALDAEPKVVARLADIDDSHATRARQHNTPTALPSLVHSASALPPATSSPGGSSVPVGLFRPSNLFSEQFGRGNNFAMGYMGRQGDEGAVGSLMHDTMEAIRRESERLDVFDSVVMMHSLAGGTGSGLGARITEEIRDHYQKQFILSCCIAPFGVGDTPLQHFNSLLSLSHLYPVSDGILLASNADLARVIAMRGRKNAARETNTKMAFDGINTYLSACIADVLAPTKLVPSFSQLEQEEAARLSGDHINQGSTAVRTTSLLATPSLHELITSVVPLPALKLMEIWSSAGLESASAAAADPRQPPMPSWKACMDALKRCVPPDDESCSYRPASIGYAVYARGDSSSDPVSTCADQLTTRLRKMLPAVSWNPFPQDMITTSLPRMTPRPLSSTVIDDRRAARPTESARSIAVCVNRVRTAHTLAPAVAKARTLLQHKAYVHWYARYGVEASDITDAVDDIDTVIRDYHECETK